MRQTETWKVRLNGLTGALTLWWCRGSQQVRADWLGGPYIDLSFWDLSFWDGPSPSEVINVMDYEAGEVRVPFHPVGLLEVVADWIATQDAEWPEWHASYIENARR